MKALTATVAALLAVAGVAGCARNDAGSEKTNAASAPGPSVALTTVREGSLVERVDAQGYVGPPAGSTAKLAFAEAGVLAKVDVRPGDFAHAGEPVAELDRAALAPPLAQARADARAAAASYAGGAIPSAAVRSAAAKLAAAQDRLQTLERGGPSAASGRTEAAAAERQAQLKVASDASALARAHELYAAGVIARKDLESATATLASDRADDDAARAKLALAATDFTSALAQARADVASARNDLQTARAQNGVLQGAADAARARLAAAQVAYAYGVVTMPADGVVLAVLKHPGEAVDPSTPVVEVGPPAGRGVTLTVPAGVAHRIVPGDAVSYGASQGRVLSVIPVVDRTTQVATVFASGAPAGALAGDAVSASIAVARTTGVLVPASAIVEDPETGKTVVFVHLEKHEAEASAFAMRAVSVRATSGSQAIVSGAIGSGDRIAAQGGYLLLAPAGG